MHNITNTIRTTSAVLFIALLSATPSALAKDAHSSHHADTHGVPAAAALKMLQEGNQRFIEGKVKHPDQELPRRKELASGQKPAAIILSCSDSRVPPELVFDQGLGDLFVIRVAGNIVDSAGMATIEYAVEHLGTRLIVVMGHESCGAVKAALTTPRGQSAGSPDLDILVSTIQPALGESDPASTTQDKTIRKPVIRNVDAVADHLLLRSKILREANEKGTLKITRAIYSLGTGKVEFWDQK